MDKQDKHDSVCKIKQNKKNHFQFSGFKILFMVQNVNATNFNTGSSLSSWLDDDDDDALPPCESGATSVYGALETPQDTNPDVIVLI